MICAAPAWPTSTSPISRATSCSGSTSTRRARRPRGATTTPEHHPAGGQPGPARRRRGVRPASRLDQGGGTCDIFHDQRQLEREASLEVDFVLRHVVFPAPQLLTLYSQVFSPEIRLGGPGTRGPRDECHLPGALCVSRRLQLRDVVRYSKRLSVRDRNLRRRHRRTRAAAAARRAPSDADATVIVRQARRASTTTRPTIPTAPAAITQGTCL